MREEEELLWKQQLTVTASRSCLLRAGLWSMEWQATSKKNQGAFHSLLRLTWTWSSDGLHKNSLQDKKDGKSQRGGDGTVASLVSPGLDTGSSMTTEGVVSLLTVPPGIQI